jgi:hypothetical protein
MPWIFAIGGIAAVFAASVIITIAVVGVILAISLIEAEYHKQEELKRLQEETDTLIEEWESTSGDPIYTPNEAKITILPLFPDQYQSWDVNGNPNQDKLFYFDFDCNGKNEMGDRNPVGTLILIRDYYPQNGKLDCGFEMFWSLEKTAYEGAQRFDTNGNCYIDPDDSHWGQFMVTDFDMAWTPKEMGYEKFKVCDPIIFEDDPFGIGIYSNGYEGYVPDYAFDEAIESGWTVPPKITDSHFRLKGLMECGATLQNGTCYNTYSGVLGYWERVN